MKKWLSLLLALVMVLSMSAVSLAEGEEIVLTVWAWDKNVDAIEEAARQYCELTGKNLKLDVQITAQPDVFSAIVACSESGDTSSLPDITLMSDTNFFSYGATYTSLFYDMTDYVDWTQVAAAKANLTVLDGRHYGVPFDSGSVCAMYRTDILEQAGYTLEDLTDVTWDRALEIGADVYAKTGHYLYADQPACINLLKIMLFSSGVPLFNEDGSAILEGNVALTKALELLKKGVDTKAIYVASDWNDYLAAMTTNDVSAGVVNGCWIANNLNSYKENAYKWDATNAPKLDGIETATAYANNGGSSWYVLTCGDHCDEAAKFLSYMFTGEGTNSLIDFITYDVGYILTYAPIVNSGYYDKIDDGMYAPGFWSKLAATSLKAPLFNGSPLFAATNTALTALSDEVLNGADIATKITEAQATLDFEFGI